MNSMLSLFECIMHSSSLLLFVYVSDFLRLFMMSFKYGLILLKYYLIDKVLFISLLLSYSI